MGEKDFKYGLGEIVLNQKSLWLIVAREHNKNWYTGKKYTLECSTRPHNYVADKINLAESDIDKDWRIVTRKRLPRKLYA